MLLSGLIGENVKLTYHTSIGGQLAKYCGEEKAMELMKQVVDNFTASNSNNLSIVRINSYNISCYTRTEVC